MRALALTLETIAGHGATEGKIHAAAAYLASQDASKVGMAARFLSGTPLPPGTPATNVGRATLVELVAAFAGKDRRELLRLATQRGDLGVAVAEVLENSPRMSGTRLSLREVAEALLALGSIGSTRRKQHLRSMLERCTPLEAKYLTKLLLGSMRTGMQATRVEESVALAFDQPISAVRRAHMLLGDIGMAAERAAGDSLETVSLKAFRPVRVMLAHPCHSTAEVLDLTPLPVIAEDKFDGIRVQAHIVDGKMRLYSRTLEDSTHFFPEIRSAAPQLPGEWILDGEVVAWVDGRALSFNALQRRLGRRQVPLTLLLDAPVIFLAFDVLRAESNDLIDVPLRERKQVLAELPLDGAVRRAPWELLEQAEDLAGCYAAATARGNEGVVFKAPDSLYRPGSRGRSWLKLKHPLGTIDVVVTGAEYGRGKRAGLLSDLVFAVRAPDGLVDSGRAYSGLTDEEIRHLTATFKQTTLRTDGTLRRVEPRIVLEVAFDDIRPSSRYPSGFALRFPRIVRQRADLTLEEISTLDDLERLHLESSD